MYEVIPVAAGLVVGCFASRTIDSRIRNALIAVLSVIIGVIASVFIAQESWPHIPFDVFQAGFASVVSLMLVKRYLRAGNR